MNQTSAQSKGKLIISGEHAVVYGEPALVGGIELLRKVILSPVQKNSEPPSALAKNIFKIFEKNYGIKVDNLQVTTLGKLPIGCGLGSSAAFAQAMFLSLLKRFKLAATKQKLFTLVQESEKFAHGNPSGVDAAAVVYGGLIEFVKNSTASSINYLDISHHFLKQQPLYLIDSGKPLETTKDMVGFVQQKLKQNYKNKDIIKKIGQTTQNLITNIKNNQFAKEYLTQNQRLLEKLGVVSESAQKMIKQIEAEGGVAKISGAGGIKNGSGIILVFTDDQEKLAHLSKHHHWKTYSTHLN